MPLLAPISIVLAVLLTGCAPEAPAPAAPDAHAPETHAPDTHGSDTHGKDTHAGGHEVDLHFPSKDGYTDPGIPGWVGRTKISTDAGCFNDTDGVLPGEAGCHTFHKGSEGCADAEAAPVGARIGEVCHTFSHEGADGATEEKVYLVETNPEKGKMHHHAGGAGHPDVFDCDAFCKGTTNPATGAAYAGGACVAVPEIDCVGEAIASAKCECN